MGDYVQSFDLNHCFLCGVEIHSNNKSKEHVFPSWLQRHLGLSSDKLTLLNGTKHSYGGMTVPCCLQCNTVDLRAIELIVEKAVKAGIAGVESLDKSLLFLWLTKIHYAIRFFELSKPKNPANNRKSPLTSQSDLEALALEHTLLQASRGKISWVPVDNPPGSIFIFKCQVSKLKRTNFDFIDSMEIPFVAIRINEIGIIASLQDWGQLSNAYAHPKHFDLPSNLHPTQFREQATILQFLALSNWRNRTILTAASSDGHLKLMPLGSLTTPAFFNSIEDLTYATYLSVALQTPVENLWQDEKVCKFTRPGDNTDYSIECCVFTGSAGLPVWPHQRR